jgi:alpha-D-ribose 1-methylphosphonate 5-phosphate C-P lyase
MAVPLNVSCSTTAESEEPTMYALQNYGILNLYLQVDNAYSTLWFISHYLIIVNAVMDPIIYGLSNENFRRAFRSSALASRLFGSSGIVTVTRAPRPPIRKLESRDLHGKSDRVQRWFNSPKPTKGKNWSTVCYI